MEEYVKQRSLRLPGTQRAVTFAHADTTGRPESHRLHFNDFVEIFISVQGELDYIVQDRAYPMSRGDVVVIAPHELHVAHLRGVCRYERYYCLIPAELFAGQVYDPLKPFVCADGAQSGKLGLGQEEKTQVLSLLERIDALGDSPREELTALALLTQLLCLPCFDRSRTVTPVGEETALPKLVRQVLYYIGENAASLNSVTQIARTFHVSASYLSTLFHACVGVSPGAYLRAKKISVARRLLEQGCSVTFAAYESGFADCSHFIRVFRSTLGVTPNAYKKQFEHNAP